LLAECVLRANTDAVRVDDVRRVIAVAATAMMAIVVLVLRDVIFMYCC
jgi:hypothetical protein